MGEEMRKKAMEGLVSSEYATFLCMTLTNMTFGLSSQTQGWGHSRKGTALSNFVLISFGKLNSEHIIYLHFAL